MLRTSTRIGSSPRVGCGRNSSSVFSLRLCLKSHRGDRLVFRVAQPSRACCSEISLPHRHFGAERTFFVLTVWIRLRASSSLLES